jgi:hypothetical protein
MQRPQIPPKQLGLAKRDPNRTWPPSRITNSWLPAIQSGPKNLRSFNRLRKWASPNKDGPFNYHDLLKEVGHSESEAQDLLISSNRVHTDLETPDDIGAIQNKKGRCADCIRLAKSRRETAASLQVARNVIESLEASASLLQARLALYEGGQKPIGHAVLRPKEDEVPPSTQEAMATREFSVPFANEIDPHENPNSAERKVTPTEKDSESLDPARVNEPPFATTDKTALRQDGSPTRKNTAQTLAVFGAKIRALATVLATQSKQIEQLKSANMELVTREDQLTKKLKAAEVARRSAEKTALFQADVMEFLASELRAERSAAKYDTMRLLYALRHERSERRAAERDINAVKNELVILLPKLAIASTSTGQR